MRGFTFVRKEAEGFTLTELLVTISILAILATVSISTYSGLQKGTRDSKRQSDLRVIQSALEQYRADQGFYPCVSYSNNCTASLSLSVAGDISLTSSSGRPEPTPTPIRTYLKSIPKDPQFQDGNNPFGNGLHKGYWYFSLPLGCDNNSGGNCISYCVYAKLEKTLDESYRPDQCNFLEMFGTRNFNYALTAP